MNINTNAYPFETGNDETERLALEECVKRQRFDQRVSVLIIPAGGCELAVKFARLGAQVIVADSATRKSEIEGRILANGQQENIAYFDGELINFPEILPGEPFDIIIVRRGLCGMPYEKARQTLRRLLLNLKIGGRLYVSVLGLHSELGDGYADAELPVEERFTKLAPGLINKYGITGEVCLYSERNLFLLLLNAGASVLRTLSTTHGNVKAVAVRV
ncbi:MAG TPA: hypothetical protein VLA64_08735 [Azonexus sp.]|nr:hypothetical protein [Azonexus sp.]